MTGSWGVFSRDLRRLLRVPRAYIIIIGVIFAPALYAWINIAAFWDPYGNIDKLRIAVVNNDEGATTELTGPINAGTTITDTLAENDTLAWEFPTEAQARDGTLSGDYYATLIIPDEFSEDLLSMFSENFTQPEILYYVNEKNNAVAPQITDAGASIIDTTISDTFKQVVAEAMTTALRDAGQDLEGGLLSARDDASGSLTGVAENLDSARAGVGDMQESVAALRPAVAEARTVLGTIDATMTSIQDTLGHTTALLEEVSATATAFSQSMTSALTEGSQAVARATSGAAASVTELTDDLDHAVSRVDSAAQDVDAIIAAGEAALASLTQLAEESRLSPEATAAVTTAIDLLTDRTAATRDIAASLGTVSANTSATLDSLEDVAASISQASDVTAATVDAAGEDVARAVPQINAALAEMSGRVASASATVATQQTLLTEASALLAASDTQLLRTTGVLEQVAGTIDSMADSVRTIESDVTALLTAAADGDSLDTVTTLDAVQVSHYLATPVEMEQETVFSVNSYGTAMSAFFTNLALWIGGFMLMIIYRVEVDKEGFRRLGVGAAYRGRFLLLGLMAALQGLVISVGNLIIGQQAASSIAFVLTAMAISVLYTAIIYALVSAWGHIGRGLAILLVVVQIPGASGLYPIELMPGLFRALYPYLPFSYGINALRETIAGFYEWDYVIYMAVLLIMSLGAFFLGLIVRMVLAHPNQMFNRSIARSGLITYENVEVLNTPYRLADVLNALSDRDEYQADINRRAENVEKNYRGQLAGGIIVGILVTVLLTAVTWIFPVDKSIMLAIVVLWGILVLFYLGAVEYTQQSVHRAQELNELEDSELRATVLHRQDSLRGTTAPAGDQQ